MADEALRMQAEVVDKFTAPLRALQNQLRGIQSGPGIKGLKADFDAAATAARNVGTVVGTVVTPAITAVGVAGVGLAGALAGVAASLRGFSTETAQLSLMSR